jgi:hypothetical protein
LIDIYNTHANRTTGIAPNSMVRSDIPNVNQKLRVKGQPALEAFKRFKIGDLVRHIVDPRVLGPLRTKHVKRFSEDIYRIKDIDGFSFILEDYTGNEAPRTYRHYELRKV